MDKIAEFKKILTQRDAEFRKHTEQLFELLTPVIDMLYDLFQLPIEDVIWNEMDITDDMLVLTASITFAPNNISPFVSTFAPVDVVNDPDVSYVEQTVRIGIPMQVAFGTEEQLRQFFDELPKTQAAKVTDTDAPDLTDNLTDDQIERLRLFEHSTSGAKH